MVGCSTAQLSPRAKAFVSLRSTQILVDSLMQTYANHVVSGQITPEKQMEVDAEHRYYQQLYNTAIQTARFGTGQPADEKILGCVRKLELLVTNLK